MENREWEEQGGGRRSREEEGGGGNGLRGKSELRTSNFQL